MIHIFNRRELTITWDMTALAKIRDILAANHVEYMVKAVSTARTSPFSPTSRARTGTYGLRTEAMYQYIVYVKNTDHEKARFLIGR